MVHFMNIIYNGKRKYKIKQIKKNILKKWKVLNNRKII